MKLTKVFSATAIPLMLCVIAACGAGQSGTAAPPPLDVVPTSAWRPGDVSLLALVRGTLRGGDERGTFCVWLAGRGRRSAIIWPAGYHARLHPFELLDAQGVVVAKGGDLISAGGGEAPVQPGRPCMLGQRSAFYVMSSVSVTRPPAATQATRASRATYGPCTAAGLTGRLGVIGLGAGQYTRHLVLTNTSGRACTLTGGPRGITGVRRDGHRVRLATGVPRDEPSYGLAGPANLAPGQGAQAVIHTTTMCQRASEGRVDDFVALDVGIAHTGEVRIDFPPGQPYDAVCGVDVSAFGIPART
jgi:hypothetical protein